MMVEVVGNLHLHTVYSDGALPHAVVAAAAARAGLDFLVVTDHNVRVQGLEGLYRTPDGRQVLLLSGEEVHDMLREPQRNHLLVYGAGKEMAPAAQGQPPQHLLDAVAGAGGLSFLAHPVEVAAPWAGEGEYGWDDLDVTGFTGIELWNTMSSVKMMLPDPVRGVFALFFPDVVMVGPPPQTLRLWDDLLRQGQHVVAIGNADAHGAVYRFGPLRKVIYPYAFLFRCVNTHVLLDAPLSGDPVADGPAIYRALAQGHAFVGYGLPGNPRGFRFEARLGNAVTAIMGDSTPLAGGQTLRIAAPAPARLKLLRGGVSVAEAYGQELIYQPTQPGIYRAEAWKRYRGRERGWIFSNPITLTGPADRIGNT